MDNSKSVGIDMHDTENALAIDGDNAVFKRTQFIDGNFLNRITDKRIASSNSLTGDLHHVASIPTVIIEKWMAEGFNIFDKNVSIKEVLRRLHSEDMTGLIATSKSV